MLFTWSSFPCGEGADLNFIKSEIDLETINDVTPSDQYIEGPASSDVISFELDLPINNRSIVHGFQSYARMTKSGSVGVSTRSVIKNETGDTLSSENTVRATTVYRGALMSTQMADSVASSLSIGQTKTLEVQTNR